MSRSGRRPWETPIQYEEDRFPDQPSRRLDEEVGGDLRPDPDLIMNRVANPQADRKEVKPRPQRTALPESLRRPIVKDGEIVAESIDADPRRPSWRDNGKAMSNDIAPLDYSRGPHDGELDVRDTDDPHYDNDD
jgi:hypothetical protein